jgi:putative FmdB family regulatory protein
MPIYEYRCTRCDHQFEVTHGVSESLERCETCGGPIRRVFSPVGIIFKGPGFHVTDYRKTPAPSNGEGKGTSQTAGDASKADGSSAEKSTTEKSTAPSSTKPS